MSKYKRIIKILVKIVLIATCAIMLIVGAGWLYLRSIMKPPEIPVHSADAAALGYTPVGNRPQVSLTPNFAQTESEPQDDAKEDKTPPPPAMHLENRRPLFFTFLIFGLDESRNADTIMVGAYDGKTQQGYIISIPRDTRVDVQRNNQKINAAYAIGQNRGGHQGGVDRLKYEVSTVIGFRPDFYISIDYMAFVRMVNAIGGVPIYVPFHMLYDDPDQDLHINIPAGMQVLDGQNALHFARYRLGNDRRFTINDYQRIAHQQQVISALFQELLTPATLLRIPEFVRIFNDHVGTDLAYGELLWFANQVRLVGTDALALYTLPSHGTSGAPYWYELADMTGIIELVNRTVNPFTHDITSADLRIVR
ncbi:MAG: LCP family protein [Oscillospiraceae bacterium]|nr:LCP family protein [Oscillospiraceae bacterium]